jgi:hypothetical protein
MAKIVVMVSGGLVQDILSTEPVEVVVIDYDTEGVEESQIIKIPQRTPSGVPVFADATAGERAVYVVPMRVNEIFGAIP